MTEVKKLAFRAETLSVERVQLLFTICLHFHSGWSLADYVDKVDICAYVWSGMWELMDIIRLCFGFTNFAMASFVQNQATS